MDYLSILDPFLSPPPYTHSLTIVPQDIYLSSSLTCMDPYIACAFIAIVPTICHNVL